MELLDHSVLDIVRRHLGQYQLVHLVGGLLTAQRPQRGVQLGVSSGQLVSGPVGSVRGEGAVPGARSPGSETITAHHDAALAAGQVEVEDSGGADITHLSHARMLSPPHHLGLPSSLEMVDTEDSLLGDHVAQEATHLGQYEQGHVVTHILGHCSLLHGPQLHISRLGVIHRIQISMDCNLPSFEL